MNLKNETRGLVSGIDQENAFQTFMHSILYSICISAIVYIFVATGGSLKYLAIMQGVFLFWVFSLIFLDYKNTYISNLTGIYVIALAVILCAVTAVNYATYNSLKINIYRAVAHELAIILFIVAVDWAIRYLQPNVILKYIAWILFPLIIIAIVSSIQFDVQGWERAMPFGIHPNWLGEVSFGFILCALSFNKSAYKFLLIAAGIGLMILVQSRGTLLATFFSLAAYIASSHRRITKKDVYIFIAVLFIILLFVLLLKLFNYWPAFVQIIKSKILVLDDPNRGMDSGFSKRLDGWIEAYHVFIKNPIFGQGFDTLTHVHNGFLRLVGEGGVLLLGFVLYMFYSAIYHSWRNRNDWAFSVIIGYIVYMFTYPRALNLNIAGIILFFAIFCWDKKMLPK